MGDITKVKYTARSIAKEEDFTYSETVSLTNLSIIFEQLVNSTNHFIITGGLVVQRGTPSMNVDVGAILGFNKASSKIVYGGSVLGPIAVTNGEASDRIDILEIREIETNYDSQTRAFKDPGTGVVSYLPIDTKIRYEYEAQVTVGVAGSGNAPSVSLGWIKLAEIFVATGETISILDADITNFSAVKDGGTNIGWTTDITHIFILKGMSELKDIFRIAHEEDGSHVADSIKDDDIDFGVAAGQVDADVMPLGTILANTPTGGTATNLASTSFTRAALTEIFARLVDLSGVGDDSIDSRHYAADSIDDEHINWGVVAGQVDADIVPLGTAVVSTPIGGTATNLADSSFTRAALQELFNRLINLSGVGNAAVLLRHMAANSIDSDQYVDGSIDNAHIADDAINSEHYAADSIDDIHINWGTGVSQVAADNIPIIDSGGNFVATTVEAALTELAESDSGVVIEQKQATDTSIGLGLDSISVTGFTGTPYAIIAIHVRTTSNDTGGWGSMNNEGTENNISVQYVSFSSGTITVTLLNGTNGSLNTTVYVTAATK